MKTRMSAISRIPALLAAVAAAMVMAACTQAAVTTKDLSFGTEGLTVAVVPTLTAGTPMADVELPEATGGSDTVTYSVAPVVPGLAFNPATRVLGGTPTAAGTFPLTYTARTAEGDEATLSFTVKVLSSFIGTWQSTHDWYDDSDDIVGTIIDTLTFTKSRYIFNRSHYRAGSTSTDDYWTHHGSWEATDGMITRIWEHDHDDLDDTPRVLTRVRKHYLWNEDRTTLCIQHWSEDSEHLDEAHCELQRRVPSPPPAELLGQWTWIGDDEDWTIEITATRFTVSTGRIEDGRFIGFTLTGTYEVNLEELFIMVTIEDALEDGTSVIDADIQWWKGQVSRWAFAPTDNPTKMVVSTHWKEHEWIESTQEWIDSTENPSGDYWLEVEKQ